MIGFLKVLWRARRDIAQPDDSLRELRAREYLDALRRDELSVGAALRRGEQVDHAPGVVVSNTPSQYAPRAARRSTASQPLSPTRRDVPPPRDAASTGNGPDFVTSFAVAAATGSEVIGFAAGESIEGAMIGAAVNGLENTGGN